MAGDATKNVGAFMVEIDSCEIKNLKIASNSVGRVDSTECVVDVEIGVERWG
jgi:hypothetical protein